MLQVFDVAAVRAALEQRLKNLESELHQVTKIKDAGSMQALCSCLTACAPTLCVHVRLHVLSPSMG